MLQISLEKDADDTSLVVDREPIERLKSMIPLSISLAGHDHPDRVRIERFIETVYARRYGTTLFAHYPLHMFVEDRTGGIAAAVGLRFAAEERLFLEQYLDSPVEVALGLRTGRTVDRREIAEIGSLASARKADSIFLFVNLAAYLQRRKFAYAVITATKALRRSFSALGFAPIELAAAKANLLPDKGASWGSYYAGDPRVIAGDISSDFACLTKYLRSEPGRWSADPVGAVVQ